MSSFKGKDIDSIINQWHEERQSDDSSGPIDSKRVFGLYSKERNRSKIRTFAIFMISALLGFSALPLAQNPTGVALQILYFCTVFWMAFSYVKCLQSLSSQNYGASASSFLSERRRIFYQGRRALARGRFMLYPLAIALGFNYLSEGNYGYYSREYFVLLPLAISVVILEVLIRRTQRQIDLLN